MTTLNPAATLCLVGRHVDQRTLSWYLDQFTAAHAMRWLLDTLDRLHSATDAGPVALERLLADRQRLAGPTESWLERVVADLLAVPGLPTLQAQYPIMVCGRRFRIDLAMPSIKLGIEAHGRTYHHGADKSDADNVRDLLISSQGWQLLYVTRSQIEQPRTLVDAIVAAARARSPAETRAEPDGGVRFGA